MRFRSVLLALLLAAPGPETRAAEKRFDLTGARPGALPADWQPLLVGGGPPAEWQVVLDEAPSEFQPLSPQARPVNLRPVFTELSKNPTDERFPLLVYRGDQYGDFTLTARIKLVEGKAEQIAGLVFRGQDERNFYVLRLSRLGDNVRFYKFVEGVRSPPVGPTVRIEAQRWYELAIEAEANRFRFLLDGREIMPPVNDSSFVNGWIGFITKSDSVARFSDVRIKYKARETLAAALVREAIEKYPRLRGVRIYGHHPQTRALEVLASSNPADVGLAASSIERGAIDSNQAYFGKDRGLGLITFPLHDRNGDPLGAVKLMIESFKGQTEANALGRVKPIVDGIQARIGAARSLSE